MALQELQLLSLKEHGRAAEAFRDAIVNSKSQGTIPEEQPIPPPNLLPLGLGVKGAVHQLDMVHTYTWQARAGPAMAT